MKNDELYVMRDGLNAVPDKVSYENVKKKGIINFKLAVSKNKWMLNNHLKDVEEAIKSSEDYSKYRKEEQGLSKKFCRKDEEGKNIIIPTVEGRVKGERYDIEGQGDPDSEYSRAFEKLENKYKKEIKERKEQLEKFNDFLEEESDFEPYLIPFNLVPDDLPQSAMDGVLFIIEFKEEKKISKPDKKKKK